MYAIFLHLTDPQGDLVMPDRKYIPFELYRMYSVMPQRAKPSPRRVLRTQVGKVVVIRWLVIKTIWNTSC